MERTQGSRSRLFHAVVILGCGLGAGVACGGSSDDDDDPELSDDAGAVQASDAGVLHADEAGIHFAEAGVEGGWPPTK